MDETLTFFSPDTLVHIGLPKAASTSLQQHYFQILPHINYVGRNSIKGEAFEHGIKDCLFKNGRVTPVETGLVADYLSADQYNVISNEGLSSGLGGTLWYHRAQLLKEMIGPNCCVLIVIRNPLTYVKSWFGEYTKNSFSDDRPVLNFDKWFELKISQESSEERRRLLFADLAVSYTHAFGRANVEVLPFEYLQNDYHKFFKKINQLSENRLGPPPVIFTQKLNPAISNGRYLYLKFRQQRNLWSKALGYTCRALGTFVPYFSKPFLVNLSAAQKQMLIELTRDQCQWISTEWDLNLEKYDYPSRGS